MMILDLPDWSLWGIIAVVLLLAEIMTVGYVALGFAVGAAVVAVLVWLLPGIAVAWQALLWAMIGLLSWLAMSRWQSRRRATRRDINDFDSRAALPPSDRRPRTPPQDPPPG